MTMQRFLFNSSGPRCTDGTPAGYFLQLAHASSPHKDSWVVWLEGGGICQSNADCFTRSQSGIGSSNYWAETMTGEQLSSSDCTANPDFCQWNHVWVPYCSGDIWVGQASTFSNPWAELDARGLGDNLLPFGGGRAVSAAERARLNDTAHTFVFEGHLIVQTISRLLAAQSPREVLLTGCSAGGIGTFENIDYLASALPGVRVSGNPQAGWFGLPISDYAHVTADRPDPDPYHLRESSWLLHANAYRHPPYERCVATRGAAFNVTCLSPPYFYPYLQTAIFVSENTLDSYQFYVQGLAPRGDVTPKVIQYARFLHAMLAGSLTKSILDGGGKQAHDGLFSPACLAHCLRFSGAGAPTVRGVAHYEALGNWYFGRAGKPFRLLDNSTDQKQLLSCADDDDGSGRDGRRPGDAPAVDLPFMPPAVEEAAAARDDLHVDPPGCQDKAFGECGAGIVPGQTVVCCPGNGVCKPAQPGAPTVCVL